MYNKRLLFLPPQITGSLVAIAGGGGGGQIIGGGGGAGGFYTGSATFTTEVTYSIDIGAGGAGSVGYSSTPNTTNGVDTEISVTELPLYLQHITGSATEFYSASFYSTMTLHGGGLGSGWDSTVAVASNNPGGSGGGGSCNGTAYSGGGILHPIQGHVGGKSSTHPENNFGDGAGGGGGGAGAPGDNAPSIAVGGHGGIGITTKISGVSRNIGGGGGGGTRSSTGNNYSNVGTGGGLYGGGRGGYLTANVGATGGATDGKVNTGGGGGCGGYDTTNSNRTGGNGGSGIVMIRVLSGSIAATTQSPNLLNSGSFTTVEFLSSGTIVFKKP